MKCNTNFFEHYLREAPLALALERTLECQILSQQSFEHPILDIGCGEGLFAKKLFNKKIDLGIDPNPKELERAEFHNGYRQLLRCTGDSIPRADGSFNTILSNSVMEHIPDIDQVLNEALRLISPEGRVYLTLPTARFDQYTMLYQLLNTLGLSRLSQQYSQLFNKFWAHYHYYSTSEWIAKFEYLGFEVLEFQEYGSKITCIVNSFAAPWSIIPFITKKLTNRWFVLDGMRKLSAKLLAFIFSPLTKHSNLKPNEGGLVFFALKKKSTTSS